MSLSTWVAFFIASWAISLSPGAGALAAMTSGLRHGFRQGLWTVPGLILGIWTQLLVVGVGLGALVAASPLAFEIVRWVGVGYLVYLGVDQWRAPPRSWGTDEPARPMVPTAPTADTTPAWPNAPTPPTAATAPTAPTAPTATTPPAERRTLILRAWALNAVNPKGTLFFLAVEPQFINLHSPLPGQYLVIGLTLAFTDLVVMVGYTALAAQVLRALNSPAQQKNIHRVFGVLFVAAGLGLALFQR